MVDRVERDGPSAERGLLRMTVHACDAVGLAREELRGEVAERGDQLRLDELDLLEEVALARLDLVGLRVAVPRRAALDHVGDVDVLAREADSGEELVEELPGLADERIALLVLVEAGRLAHEHEVGGGIAHAEDDLRPPRRELAACASRRFRRVGRELGAAAQCVRIRSHSPRRSIRLRRIRRSSVARRCREPRTRKAGGASSRSRSPGSPDRRRPAARAPRSGSRTTCTRTRRSASPRQSRQLPGQSANDCGRS